MGGRSSRHQHQQHQQRHGARPRGADLSGQFSLSNFVGNLSGRSILSVTSEQSVYSAQRPWSRVSRRRWHDSTLNSPYDASKTAWPVPHVESLFLPEFPITTELAQKEFVIKETIAKGAFGEVFKVERANLNKEYALKVLRKAQIVSDNAVGQVKEEAKIQEACGHHTFIVGAVSRWQTKKRLYIVSEYVPGGELLGLINKYGTLPEELVKIFVAELALALDFLHNAGVIYRDLKPENVLLDAECHLQLIDFGLSKWLSMGARTTEICGTLNYMAPEILSREPYGHAVDWWSLGVVACMMLTNQCPTPAVEARASYSEIPSGVVAKPGSLPPSANLISEPAKKLLLRLLETSPQHRMRSLRQMQQSAFYMGFNFDDVRAKKVSPKSILDKHYPEGPPGTTNMDNDNGRPCYVSDDALDDYSEDLRAASEKVFAQFDNITIV